MAASLPYEPGPDASALRPAVTTLVPAVEHIPSPVQAEVRYTLSLQESRAAHALVRAAAPGELLLTPPPPQRKQNPGSNVVGWLLFIALAVLLTMLNQRTRPPKLPEEQPPPAPSAFKTIGVSVSVILTGTGLLSIVIFSILGRARARRYERMRAGDYLVRLDHHGVFARGPLGVDWVAWSALSHLTDSGGMLRLEHQMPGWFVAVPKRVFVSPSQLTEFLSLARDRLDPSSPARDELPPPGADYLPVDFNPPAKDVVASCRFSLTRDQSDRLLRQTLRWQRWRQPFLFWVIGVPGLLIGSLGFAVLHTLVWLIPMVIAGLLLLVSWRIVFGSPSLLMKVEARQEWADAAPITVTVTNGHLIYHCRRKGHLYRWTDVTNVDQGTAGDFAVVHGGTLLTSVPEAFTSSAERERFLTCIRDRIGQSWTATAAVPSRQT